MAEEGLQIADERREMNKTERERQAQLNSEFQNIGRRDKKAFLSEQCKELEENNRMWKAGDLFKKMEISREHFMHRWAQ